MVNTASSALGYGRKRRVGRPRVTRVRRVTMKRRPLTRRRRVGGSLRSILSSAHNFLKSNKLVSKRALDVKGLLDDQLDIVVELITLLNHKSQFLNFNDILMIL